ncbi:hypothetical protein [Richelia sinica]
MAFDSSNCTGKGDCWEKLPSFVHKVFGLEYRRIRKLSTAIA